MLIGYEKELRRLINREKLVPVLENFTIPSREMHLLYDPLRVNESRYQVFIDEMIDYLS